MLTLRTAAVVLLLAISNAATADNSTAKAKELYDVGLTDYNLGHYEEALVAFEQAYRIRHDPALLFNIGQCQRQLHHYVDAQRSYRAYLRESQDVSDSTRDQVQKLVAEMQKAIDDERAKQPPPVTPSRAERAEPQPNAPAPSPMSVSQADNRAGQTKMIAGIAIAAFGVAAIATGGGFYAVASSANDSLNHPSNGTYSASAEDRRNTFQSLDISAFVVGGVAFAAGATIAVVGWRQRHHLTVTPMASRSGVGASVDVQF